MVSVRVYLGVSWGDLHGAEESLVGSLCPSLPLLPYGEGPGGLHLPHPVVWFGRPGHLLVPVKHQGLVGSVFESSLPGGWRLHLCPSVPRGLVTPSMSLAAPGGGGSIWVPRCLTGLLLRPCPSVPHGGGGSSSVRDSRCPEGWRLCLCLFVPHEVVAPSMSHSVPRGCCSVRCPQCPAGLLLPPCPSVPHRVVAPSMSLGAPQGCCSVHVPRCPTGLLLCPCPSVPHRVVAPSCPSVPLGGVSVMSICILCGDKGWSGHG